MLLVQAICKPKLSNQASNRLREAVKVFGIYLIALLVSMTLQIYSYLLTQWTVNFVRGWIDELLDHEMSYTCTDPSLWINLDFIVEKTEVASSLSNLETVKILTIVHGTLSVLQYIANVRFIWKMDIDYSGGASEQSNPRIARAISVGIPVELEFRLNRSTGQSNGVAVPEADRTEHKAKLAILKR